MGGSVVGGWMVLLLYCCCTVLVYCCTRLFRGLLVDVLGTWVSDSVGGIYRMGGVDLVHGLWVGECVGIILAPLAYRSVHWRCKRATSNLKYASC